MRIGLTLPTPGATLALAELLDEMEQAEALGLHSIWMPNIRSLDALTTLALAGPRTSRIELGTFVVPTYPRHPSAMAQQALTVQAATGNRLTLGIGLNHRPAIEDQLGLDFSRPVRHMREYLQALAALCSGHPATFAGEEFRITNYHLSVPDAQPPSVLVAALGPQMLRLTGHLADGTAIWLGGPRYLAETVVPEITEAARAAGRPEPRVLISVPVCVTDQPEAAREHAATFFARYGTLPSYRAVLDREGVANPADVAIIGNEAAVNARLDALAAAGATDFGAAVFAPPGHEVGRTLALLQRRASATG